jgi:hypothetical protein
LESGIPSSSDPPLSSVKKSLLKATAVLNDGDDKIIVVAQEVERKDKRYLCALLIVVAVITLAVVLGIVFGLDSLPSSSSENKNHSVAPSPTFSHHGTLSSTRANYPPTISICHGRHVLARFEGKSKGTKLSFPLSSIQQCGIGGHS